MAENTKIEWATHTWNPWMGCTKVSPACDHCYAEKLVSGRLNKARWGAGEPRTKTLSVWGDPFRWNKAAAKNGRIDTVFCLSLGDIWDKEVPWHWRSDAFGIMEQCESLVFPTDSSKRSSPRWKAWATALRRDYSARPKWGRATGASDCSSWPTARVARGGYTRDHGDPERERPSLEGAAAMWPTARTSDTNGPGAHGDGGVDLRTATATWGTPRASGGAKGGPNMAFGAGGTPLPAQAARWFTPNVPNGGRVNPPTMGPTGRLETGKKRQVGLGNQITTWATATARMYRGGGKALVRADGKSRLDTLDWQAEAFRSSPPAPPTDDGAASSPDTPASRLQLNVAFAEWLMGLPIGWTGFGPSATRSSRWLSRVRGYHSRLCSPPPPSGRLL